MAGLLFTLSQRLFNALVLCLGPLVLHLTPMRMI